MNWMRFRHKDGAYQIIPWPEEKSPVFDPAPGEVDRKLLIQKAADVPEDERADYMWIADRALLEAWLKLHDTDGSAAGLLPAG